MGATGRRRPRVAPVPPWRAPPRSRREAAGSALVESLPALGAFALLRHSGAGSPAGRARTASPSHVGPRRICGLTGIAGRGRPHEVTRAGHAAPAVTRLPGRRLPGPPPSGPGRHPAAGRAPVPPAARHRWGQVELAVRPSFEAARVSPVHPEWDDPTGKRMRLSLYASLGAHVLSSPCCS